MREKNVDDRTISKLSMFEEGDRKQIRIANLMFVASSSVTGVTQSHTDLLKEGIYSSFNDQLPGRLTDMQVGVNPRRWLRLANKDLFELI